jgi:hypothetical protein
MLCLSPEILGHLKIRSIDIGLVVCRMNLHEQGMVLQCTSQRGLCRGMGWPFEPDRREGTGTTIATSVLLANDTDLDNRSHLYDLGRQPDVDRDRPFRCRQHCAGDRTRPVQRRSEPRRSPYDLRPAGVRRRPRSIHRNNRHDTVLLKNVALEKRCSCKSVRRQ